MYKFHTNTTYPFLDKVVNQSLYEGLRITATKSHFWMGGIIHDFGVK